MTFYLRLVATCIAISLYALPAHAHKPSDSYLFLRAEQGQVRGRWDIALRDLETAVGLDGDANGQVTWDELQKRGRAVRDYAASRLVARTDSAVCSLQLDEPKVVEHSDGAYAALALKLTCPGDLETLQLEYGLLFDIDAQHRGVLRAAPTTGGDAVIFSKARPRQRVALTGAAPASSFWSIVRLGVEHIWEGYDHLLFLLALLLPSVLRRDGKRWLPVATFRTGLADVLRIVTAFTVAHSLTLALATLRWVELPPRWVESAIALSVVLAALNNLFPAVRSSRWVAALGLGLLHGFGFAATLADLGLEGGGFARTLFGFNIGVELGQIAVVLLLLPLLHALSRSPQYPRFGLMLGSCAVLVVSSLWFVERAFQLRIIS